MRFYLVIFSLLSVYVRLSTAIQVSSDASIAHDEGSNTIQNQPHQPHSRDTETQWVLGGELEYNVTAMTVENVVKEWLRGGLDTKAAYYVVDGQQEPLHKDHFIELQYVRNVLLGYPGWPGSVALEDLYALTLFVNRYDNIFKINNKLNTYKGSKVSISNYITDDRIRKEYLCKPFRDQDPKMIVARVVYQYLNDMTTHDNTVVRYVGIQIANFLNLNNLDCNW